MLLSKDKEINTYFIEYPISQKEYNNPLEVLRCDAGIMYENIDEQFHIIAFIDLKENNYIK